MKHTFVALVVFTLLSCSGTGRMSPTTYLSGFTSWRTGHDEQTVQLAPSIGNNPVVNMEGRPVVYVKFKVSQYGEVSFPINKQTPEGTEALKTDLSASRFVRITYKANHEFIVQLRQTGVHGGIQPHVTLAAAETFTTVTIPYNRFTGGLAPLDLTDVAKFNFAFLSNNTTRGYAELAIRDITIDGYKP